MRPLIEKELREHAPAAGLGLVAGVLLSMYSSVRDSRLLGGLDLDARRRDPSDWAPLPIARGSYVTGLVFVCGAVALALGLLLSWKEDLKGTWPFLLHRPVTRGEVLRSKLAAGAMLYAAATVPPFAMLALWSAWPGNYPVPWSPRCLLGGTAAILAGLAVFAGALLAGLRRARWYSTRLAPVTAALTLLVTGLAGMTWTTLLCGALASFALLSAAAWEQLASRRALKPLSLFVVATGIVGPAFLGVAYVVGEVENLRRPAVSVPEVERLYDRFSIGGEARVVAVRDGNYRVRTQDGTELERDLSSEQADRRMAPSVYLHQGPALRSPARLDEAPIQPVGRWDRGEPTRLFALVGEGILCAMDLRTARPVAFWGKGGRAASRDAVVPFSGLSGSRAELDGYVIAIDEGGVHVLDLVAGTATLGHTGPVLSVEARGGRLFVRKQGAVEVSAPGRAGMASYPLPDWLDRERWFEVSALPGDTLGVLVRRVVEAGGRNVEQVRMIKLHSSDGAVLWDSTLERPTDSAPAPEVSQNEAAQLTAMTAVSPLGLTLAVFGSRPPAPRLQAVMGSPARAALFGALWLACAAAGAALVRRRGGRTLAGAAAGAVLCLLFGVPGVLALWAELDEARVPCPDCKGPRLPSASRCGHCGAGWPPVERRDIDILPAAAA